MQAPIHLLTGTLIQKSLSQIQPLSLQYPMAASLAFLSNGVLDKLGKATYHPPKPLWKDKFWLAYHSLMVLFTACITLRFWTKYQVGIIFSVLPDLEWLGGSFLETKTNSSPILLAPY